MLGLTSGHHLCRSIFSARFRIGVALEMMLRKASRVIDRSAMKRGNHGCRASISWNDR